jgi:hypothetical protein
MAKMNYDRVRVERAARRYGSEYVRTEREVYYRGTEASAPAAENRATSRSSVGQRSSVPATATPTVPRYVPCPHCRAKVKCDRLEKHVSKVHASSGKPAPMSAASAALPRPVPVPIEAPREEPVRADTREAEDAPLADAPPSPFNDAVLRDWFFEAFSDSPFGEGVATIGSGPFDENDFDEFIRRKGLEAYAITEDTDVLVVGHEGWREEDLLWLLDVRAGKYLRVYSQEMLLSYWASWRDPFEDEEIARRFGEGHPALEFLSRIGFDWPSTLIAGGGGGTDKDLSEELPIVGMLKHVGYTVGKSGLPDEGRREVLRHVFDSRLPTVVSVSYTEEWGAPRSKERLQKMANSIATFCRNEKRKSKPSLLAIEDWEGDLDWLRKTLYSGRFKFQWPSVSGR